MARVIPRSSFKLFRQSKNLITIIRNSSEFQHAEAKIGNREIVGYGYNSIPCYVDRLDFPFPAIRWKEISPEYCALHEKERGDWRTLTLDEKKALYRYSYCRTFAELKAGTGEWKSVVGLTCMYISLALAIFIYNTANVYDPRPFTYEEKNKRIQLRRIIDLQMDPVYGLCSKWDYEKDDWKKK